MSIDHDLCGVLNNGGEAKNKKTPGDPMFHNKGIAIPLQQISPYFRVEAAIPSTCIRQYLFIFP